MRALNYSGNHNETWLVWILVTGISWVIGLFIAAVFSQSILASLPFGSGLVFGLAAGGILIGFIQWQFLQPEVEKIGVWMLATMLGWGMGFLVTLLVARFVNLISVSLFGGALGGIIFGFAQWRVMIPKVRGRTDWLLMTMLSWITALTVGAVAARKAQLLTIQPGFDVIGSAIMLGWTFITLVGGVILIFTFPKPDKHPFSGGDWT
jgi:hypothetical protein